MGCCDVEGEVLMFLRLVPKPVYGSSVIPNGLWLIHLPALALALGRRFIHPSEAHAPLILEGLERLTLHIGLFPCWSFTVLTQRS